MWGFTGLTVHGWTFSLQNKRRSGRFELFKLGSKDWGGDGKRDQQPGGLCWSLTGICCKIFVQVGFLRKSRSQNTVLLRFYGLENSSWKTEMANGTEKMIIFVIGGDHYSPRLRCAHSFPARSHTEVKTICSAQGSVRSLSWRKVSSRGRYTSYLGHTVQAGPPQTTECGETYCGLTQHRYSVYGGWMALGKCLDYGG